MRISTPVQKKLIPANKDGSYLIPENETHLYHVLCTRITILPGDPLHPLRNSWVQCFEPATWLRFQQLKNDPKMPVDWQKSALVAESRVVHDPTIKSK